MTLNALLALTYSLTLTTLNTLDTSATAIDSETVYKTLSAEFDLDLIDNVQLSDSIDFQFNLENELSIESNTEILHPDIIRNTQVYILQITSTATLYVLRKIIQAYPDKLTDIADIKILDYYEIEQGGN